MPHPALTGATRGCSCQHHLVPEQGFFFHHLSSEKKERLCKMQRSETQLLPTLSFSITTCPGNKSNLPCLCKVVLLKNASEHELYEARKVYVRPRLFQQRLTRLTFTLGNTGNI